MNSVVVALATFAVIFPAELPDKSMFAAVVLGSRYRALPVWLGLASAFLIHVIIAVTAGGVIGLLPHKIVAGVVTAFFVAGAALLFFSKDEEQEGEAEADSEETDEHITSPFRIASMAFGIIFVSEWGDLTQIATVNLAARYDDPIAVGVGATSALWLITGLGVLLGRRLVRSIPMKLVRRIAGSVLLALAVWSFVDLIRSF